MIGLDYTQVRLFSDWEIVYHLAGAITNLSPDFRPRFFYTIIDEFFTKFKESERTENSFNSYTIYCSYNELLIFLKDILMSIPKFVDLNLTTNEYKNGVDVNSSNRNNIYITTTFTERNADNDFIDLNACIQNIVNGLYREKEIFQDGAY